MAPPLSPALPERRVRTRAWSGKGVRLGEVASQLGRLHLELSREEAEEHGHPHPRNCVMNLVICVATPTAAILADQVVQRIAAAHPLRAIILSIDPNRDGGSNAGLEAEVLTEAHHLVRGTTVQREQVRLEVGIDVLSHLASLLEPLLLSDVPTYLWWTGTPPLTDPRLRAALEVCTLLVVDSADFEDGPLSFVRLAQLAERAPGRVAFADLQWSRQLPWRESVAQVFGPPERLPFLDDLRELSVVCAGPSGRAWPGAALLVGWVASALGWSLQAAKLVGSDTAEARMLSPAGREVQVGLHAAEASGLVPGTLLGVRLESGWEGQPRSVSIEVEGGLAEQARLRLDLEGGALEQYLRLPSADTAQLLVDTLAGAHRDRVLMRSLRSAAALVEALSE